MRSVFLIFEEKYKDKVDDFLDHYCDKSQKDPRLVLAYDKTSTGVLYVRDYEPLKPDDPLELDEIDLKGIFYNRGNFYFEDIATIDLLAGLHNPYELTVDISGRFDGTAEVLDFVKAFLKEIPAFTLDDYTDHFWTHEEIVNHSKFEDHPFFDYNG